MEKSRLAAAALCALAFAGTPASADTSTVSTTGFVSSFRAELTVPTDVAWKSITQLPRWWNDQHTWSGKAANMSLDLVAGGCWCERWGEGESVMHGHVVLVQPGRLLRLNAQLGPLQDQATNGVLTLAVGSNEGKTLLRMSYRVSGGADAGLDKLAPLVDRVMGEQFARLKAHAEGARLN